MALDEQARHRLHMRLDEVLGPEVTGTLMELLPPVGWADVATRQDLDALGHRIDAQLADHRADMGSQFADHRAETNGQLAALRAEIGDLRTDTGAEVAEVRTEVRTGLAAVRVEVADLRTEVRTGLAGVRTEMADLRADLTGEIASSQRLLLFGMLAAMFSLAGLVWGALTFAG